ncbi:MaoC/PaaZ C-terminal domain-containing protein [Azoarcus sp. DN11]|uniref:MaoC/PaaZ C-terminal domain-containing protein n=1 Tax=Azoarcus sp. DN11 TaxID=356837 RepID=UPI000EB43554|nr:MaoC/PaaZ C-terminal domain-containing protein [Azoarcus sp. DN11]AYH45363.1 hypothetical protein CDA09_18600 [Azoarcus sp. DN11]
MDTCYEDVNIGVEHVSPGRTITEADIVAFSAFTGDWFPLHSDEEYSKRGPFKTRIAQGLLGLALTEGMKFRIPEFMRMAYVASLYWNYRFTAPIHIGDTLRLKVRIDSKRTTKNPERGLVVEYIGMLNQRDELVGEGEHGLLIRCRS